MAKSGCLNPPSRPITGFFALLILCFYVVVRRPTFSLGRAAYIRTSSFSCVLEIFCKRILCWPSKATLQWYTFVFDGFFFFQPNKRFHISYFRPSISALCCDRHWIQVWFLSLEIKYTYKRSLSAQTDMLEHRWYSFRFICFFLSWYLQTWVNPFWSSSLRKCKN